MCNIDKKKDGLSALQERMNLLEKRYKNRSQWPIRGPELGNLSVMLIAKKASTVRKPKKAWTLASALHIIMPHYPVKFSFPKLSSKSTQHFPASNHPVVFASKQPINQTDCIPSPKKKKQIAFPCVRPALQFQVPTQCSSRQLQIKAIAFHPGKLAIARRRSSSKYQIWRVSSSVHQTVLGGVTITPWFGGYHKNCVVTARYTEVSKTEKVTIRDNHDKCMIF